KAFNELEPLRNVGYKNLIDFFLRAENFSEEGLSSIKKLCDSYYRGRTLQTIIEYLEQEKVTLAQALEIAERYPVLADATIDYDVLRRILGMIVEGDQEVSQEDLHFLYRRSQEYDTTGSFFKLIFERIEDKTFLLSEAVDICKRYALIFDSSVDIRTRELLLEKIIKTKGVFPEESLNALHAVSLRCGGKGFFLKGVIPRLFTNDISVEEALLIPETNPQLLDERINDATRTYILKEIIHLKGAPLPKLSQLYEIYK
ncbi:hypothetical protein HY620_03430, partial [Candidatus Uhrbacteria bacterium]|nr:hypothetical protein [Candidatus Uhrbacteria bacterium]